MTKKKLGLSLTGILFFLFASSVSGQGEVTIPKFEIAIKSGIYRNTQWGKVSIPYGSKYLTDNYATLFLSVKRRSVIKGLYYGISFGTFRFESNITPNFNLNNPAKEEIPHGYIYSKQRLYSGCFDVSYRRMLPRRFFIEANFGIGGLFQGKPQFNGLLGGMPTNVLSPEIIHKISIKETNRLSLLTAFEANFGKVFKEKYSASIGFSYMRNFGNLGRSGLTPIQDQIQLNDQAYQYDFNSRFSAYALSLKFALYLNQFKSSTQDKKEYKRSKAMYLDVSSVSYLDKGEPYPWEKNAKTSKGISISIAGSKQFKSSLFSIGFKSGVQSFSRTTEFNFIYNNKDTEAIPTGSMTVNQLALFAYPELIVQKTFAKRITIHAELGSGIMYMLRPSLEYQMTTAKGNDQLSPEVLVSGLIINTHRLCNYSTFGLGADYRLNARHAIGISASCFASPQFSNRTEFAPIRAVVQVNDQSYAYFFSTTIIGIKAGLRYTYDF